MFGKDGMQVISVMTKQGGLVYLNVEKIAGLSVEGPTITLIYTSASEYFIVRETLINVVNKLKNPMTLSEVPVA